MITQALMAGRVHRSRRQKGQREARVTTQCHERSCSRGAIKVIGTWVLVDLPLCNTGGGEKKRRGGRKKERKRRKGRKEEKEQAWNRIKCEGKERRHKKYKDKDEENCDQDVIWEENEDNDEELNRKKIKVDMKVMQYPCASRVGKFFFFQVRLTILR